MCHPTTHPPQIIHRKYLHFPTPQHQHSLPHLSPPSSLEQCASLLPVAGHGICHAQQTACIATHMFSNSPSFMKIPFCVCIFQPLKDQDLTHVLHHVQVDSSRLLSICYAPCEASGTESTPRQSSAFFNSSSYSTLTDTVWMGSQDGK